jgi:cytochrome c2
MRVLADACELGGAREPALPLERSWDSVAPQGWTSGARFGLFAALLAMLSVQPAREGSARSAPTVRGDAERGARLFATLPCASCHDVTRPWPGGDICPNLGNIATEATRIVRSREYRGRARTAAEYIRESIVNPNAYIVPGAMYRTAEGQSVMPKDFGQTLKAPELDDLVAYLLTRR